MDGDVEMLTAADGPGHLAETPESGAVAVPRVTTVGKEGRMMRTGWNGASLRRGSAMMTA